MDIVIVAKVFPISEPGPESVYVNKAFTELAGLELHRRRSEPDDSTSWISIAPC